MLVIKKTLSKLIQSVPVVVSASASTGSISASGYKNQTVIPTAPSGKTLVGIVGAHITGTNSSYCQIIGYYIYGNECHVQMKNTASSSVTWTVAVDALYM